ncbi:MAG: polysaccharide biosynthesis C-terminal domain-containing protein, partial [Coriobacteriia bacterium]|nr:polysaccharide biosynthesis C-terminal domain-containing protein [Coriobacteriia bacterium]
EIIAIVAPLPFLKFFFFFRALCGGGKGEGKPQLRKGGGGKKAPLPSETKKGLVKISLTAAVTNATSAILYQIDVLLVGSLLVSSIAVANYRVAALIPSALVFISSTVMIYLYPYFARNRNDHKWCFEKYRLTTLIIAGSTLLITIVLVLFAEPLIPLIFGKGYSGVSRVFVILMFSYLANGGFRVVAGNILASQRKFTANLVISAIAVVIEVTLCLILIPRLGIEGAAWSTLITMVITAVIINSYLIKCLRTRSTWIDEGKGE